MHVLSPAWFRLDMPKATNHRSHARLEKAKAFAKTSDASAKDWKLLPVLYH